MPSDTNLRRLWFPPDNTADPPFAARHRIADEVRGIIDRLVGLDVTAVGEGELASLESAAGDLRRRLEALPDCRAHGSLSAQGPPFGTLVERSPVSGRSNALAMPLEYDFDDENGITHATAVFSTAYEGPPGGVHGGYVAAAFDELLGVAQMITGLAGFTGTLTVRYHELTPVGQRIDYTAGTNGRDGRKITMWARATAGDVLVAEAEGIFIAQVRIND